MTTVQKLLLLATLVFFIVIALVGCGAEGGQASPNGGETPVVNGIDRKEVEFEGTNMEVQVVDVGPYSCVVAQTTADSAAVWCDKP